MGFTFAILPRSSCTLCSLMLNFDAFFSRCFCCWIVFWASSVFSTSRTNERATVMQPFSCISRCANAFNAGSHCYTPFFFSIRCISIVFVSLIHIAFLVRSENPGKCQQKTNTILIYHALLRPHTKCRTYFSSHWNCSRFCRKWTTTSIAKQKTGIVFANERELVCLCLCVCVVLLSAVFRLYFACVLLKK